MENTKGFKRKADDREAEPVAVKKVDLKVVDKASPVATMEEAISGQDQRRSKDEPEVWANSDEEEEEATNSEEEEEEADYGLDDAMAEQKSRRAEVLEAETILTEKVRNGNQIPVGPIDGSWTLYSPQHLELYYREGPDFWTHLDDYTAGELRFGQKYNFNEEPLSIEDTLGILDFEGEVGDWFMPFKTPEYASCEEQLESATQGEDTEVKVYCTFLGDGMMKMRISADKFGGGWRDGDVEFYGILDHSADLGDDSDDGWSLEPPLEILAAGTGWIEYDLYPSTNAMRRMQSHQRT